MTLLKQILQHFYKVLCKVIDLVPQPCKIRKMSQVLQNQPSVVRRRASSALSTLSRTPPYHAATSALAAIARPRCVTFQSVTILHESGCRFEWRDLVLAHEMTLSLTSVAASRVAHTRSQCARATTIYKVWLLVHLLVLKIHGYILQSNVTSGIYVCIGIE